MVKKEIIKEYMAKTEPKSKKSMVQKNLFFIFGIILILSADEFLKKIIMRWPCGNPCFKCKNSYKTCIIRA